MMTVADFVNACTACGSGGSASFGASAFGNGGGGVVDARVEGPTSLLVTFDIAPRSISRTDLRDILRAANWYTVLISPGVGRTPRVQWVERITSVLFRVQLDALPTPGALYGVWFSTTVLAQNLVSTISCRCLEFRGVAPVIALPRSVAHAQLEGITDLANPFTERDAGKKGAPLSTLQPTSAGDYALDTGLVGLRKRIWRRLISQPGGFYHLPSTYGLAWKLKGLIRPSQLFELQARAQQQALMEPDVQRASAEVRRAKDEPSVVFLIVRAVSKTGELAELQVPFTLAA